MAQATLTGSPIPMVSAHANASNDAAVASAGIVYYMEVTGGSGASPVTLDVTASGSASASGGGATAGGGLEIQDSNSLAIVAAWTTCANIIYPAGCSGIRERSISRGRPCALYSNTLYAVNITAVGSVGGCLSGPCALQTGDARSLHRSLVHDRSLNSEPESIFARFQCGHREHGPRALDCAAPLDGDRRPRRPTPPCTRRLARRARLFVAARDAKRACLR